MFLSNYCTQIFCHSGLRSITKVSWSKFNVVKMSFFVSLEAVVARTMEGTQFEIREFISARFPYHILNGRDVCFDLERPHWLIQLSFINRNCRQPSFGNARLRAASSILLNLASFLATRTDKWTNHFPLVLGLPLIVRREEQLLIVPVTSNSWPDRPPFSVIVLWNEPLQFGQQIFYDNLCEIQNEAGTRLIMAYCRCPFFRCRKERQDVCTQANPTIVIRR